MLRRIPSLLVVLVLSVMLIACGTSNIKRLQIALEAAPLIPGAEKPCVQEGLRGVSLALDRMKADPTRENWQLLKDAALNFNVSACTDNARVVAIFGVIQRIVQTVDPQPTLSSDEPVTEKGFKEALKHIDKADVEELERLVREAKR